MYALCVPINCQKLDPVHGCACYSLAGMKMRNKMGYCPIPDDGPNRATPKSDQKKRVGQQKQKKSSSR